jgi:hypothetical protein
MSEQVGEDIDFDDDDGPTGESPPPSRFVVVMRAAEEALRLETQLVKRGFTGIMAHSHEEALAFVDQHHPFALIYCRSVVSNSRFVDEVRAVFAPVKIVQLQGKQIMTIAGTIGDVPDLLAALVQSGIRLSPRFMPHDVLAKLPGKAA